jgi:DNA-binding PadR family transcriptional regulator
MREVKSKYAILGMLSIAPMSGYDIKKEVENSISNFWSESYGQIYPVLKSLIAEKLVTKNVESEAGKPDRHVYALTAKGRKELRRWLLEGFAPKVQRNEFLLKLFFGAEIGTKTNIAHVEQYRELQRALLQKYAAVEKELTREYAGEPKGRILADDSTLRRAHQPRAAGVVRKDARRTEQNRGRR